MLQLIYYKAYLCTIINFDFIPSDLQIFKSPFQPEKTSPNEYEEIRRKNLEDNKIMVIHYYLIFLLDVCKSLRKFLICDVNILLNTVSVICFPEAQFELIIYAKAIKK